MTGPAHFEIVTSDAGPRLRVVAGNGEVVAVTEVYDRKITAVHAVSVLCGAVDALRAGASVVELDERTPDADQPATERADTPVEPAPAEGGDA